MMVMVALMVFALLMALAAFTLSFGTWLLTSALLSAFVSAAA